MTFTEASAFESLIRDLLCGDITHNIAAIPGFATHRPKVVERADDA